MLIREKDINHYQELTHSDDYLMHYGKLGMKWGRRKAKLTVREYNKQRNKTYKDLEKNHRNTKTVNNLYKRQKNLVENYTFDADDGGGTKTKADKIAAKEYMKNWGKIEALESQRTKEVSSQVDKVLSKKYGKQTINKVKKTKEFQRNLKIGAAGVAALGLLVYKVNRRR